MPRSNKPRNFANPKIKLVNLKITPTKYKIQNTKKKKNQQIRLTKTKPKPKFCSQKHENKKTPTHPVVGL